MLQQSGCGSLDSKNEVRSDSSVLAAGSHRQKGAGEYKSEREIKGHSEAIRLLKDRINQS